MAEGMLPDLCRAKVGAASDIKKVSWYAVQSEQSASWQPCHSFCQVALGIEKIQYDVCEKYSDRPRKEILQHHEVSSWPCQRIRTDLSTSSNRTTYLSGLQQSSSEAVPHEFDHKGPYFILLGYLCGLRQLSAILFHPLIHILLEHTII